MSTASLQPSAGCTLAAYAAAKGLPIEFLVGLGLYDLHLQGVPAVGIPYFDAEGRDVARRFRLAVTKTASGDGRFRWRQGSKPCLYGLSQLPEAGQIDSIVLVEGESDAQTLMFHGIHALGIPGVGTWNNSWARQLEAIPRIYVVVEPDSGGEVLIKRLSTSPIRDRLCLVTLGECKDPSELYQSDPGGFPAAWAAAIGSARPWHIHAAAVMAERMQAALANCATLARDPDLLGRFVEEVAWRGVAGEVRVLKLIYLCLTSRFFRRPVSAVVKGTSSAGKSFLVEQALEFLPPSAYHTVTAMSERVLAYSEVPLRHRFLVLFEMAGLHGQFASYLLRSLLSEGRLRYEFTEKTADGRLEARVIEREGPTGLLVTTTKPQLHPENETRMISIPADDSREQTRAVMKATAEEDRGPSDLGPWHALQEWLEGAEHRVAIPYAKQLASAIPPVAVRLRRDFGLVLTLIKAHALLHQASRGRDGQGRVIATLTDYCAVHELVADLVSEGAQATIPKSVRETVAAVEALHRASGKPISIAQVAEYINRDETVAWRRVQASIKLGYIWNSEERRGCRARLEPGEPMPKETTLLPAPDSLADGEDCAVAEESVGTSRPPPSAGNAGLKSVAPAVESALDTILAPRAIGACPRCGGTDFTVSAYGPVICRGCHAVVAGDLETAIEAARRELGLDGIGPESRMGGGHA